MKRNETVVNICKHGLHSLATFFILSLLCLAVCCTCFYLFENSKLVSNTKMERVVLKSEPTECLVAFVHLDGCKSFNVFYNESRGLFYDLFSISDRMLQKNSFAMHFTVNEQVRTQLSTEVTTEVTLQLILQHSQQQLQRKLSIKLKNLLKL